MTPAFSRWPALAVLGFCLLLAPVHSVRSDVNSVVASKLARPLRCGAKACIIPENKKVPENKKDPPMKKQRSEMVRRKSVGVGFSSKPFGGFGGGRMPMPMLLELNSTKTDTVDYESQVCGLARQQLDDSVTKFFWKNEFGVGKECVSDCSSSDSDCYSDETLSTADSTLYHSVAIPSKADWGSVQENPLAKSAHDAHRAKRSPALFARAFGDEMCNENDVCWQAGALLTAWAITCAGSVPPMVTVYEDHELDMDINALARAFKDDPRRPSVKDSHHYSQVGGPGDASNVMTACDKTRYHSPMIEDTLPRLVSSLSCPCKLLKPPSSRSNAVIMKSSDELYIVKRIKSDEAKILSQLIESNGLMSSNIPRVLGSFLYADQSRKIVIMPNEPEMGRRAFRGSYQPQQGGPKAPGDCQVEAVTTDIFDVKPLVPRLTSVERNPLMARLLSRRTILHTYKNWRDMNTELFKTLEKLVDALLVDYSLLVSFHEAAPPPEGCEGPATLTMPLSATSDSSCMLSPACAAGAASDHTGMAASDVGLQTHCEAVCVKIIDYLMYFDWKRNIESKLKEGKWEKFGENHLAMWVCFSDLRFPGCEMYREDGCAYLIKVGNFSADAPELDFCRGTTAFLKEFHTSLEEKRPPEIQTTRENPNAEEKRENPNAEDYLTGAPKLSNIIEASPTFGGGHPG